MPRSPHFPSARAALVLAALALPLGGCDGTVAEPLAAPAEAPAAGRAAVTDAELAAEQLRTEGSGARIW